MKHGTCHICNNVGDLTFEHVPPKSAFNKASDLLSYGFDSKTNAWVPSKANPYGVGEYTLCAKCNNDTGGIYGQSFCEFVSKVADITKSNTAYRQPIKIAYKGYLHRILKQILVMFCTANGPDFSSKNNLAEYLLNFQSMNFPSDMRVYLLLVNRLSNISTGLQGTLNVRTNKTIMASEILFWPLGYILSFDEIKQNDIKDAFITEITHWKNYEIDKKIETEFDLFKNYRLTIFPLDYRSKSEIEALTGQPLKPPGKFPMIDYEI